MLALAGYGMVMAGAVRSHRLRGVRTVPRHPAPARRVAGDLPGLRRQHRRRDRADRTASCRCAWAGTGCLPAREPSSRRAEAVGTLPPSPAGSAAAGRASRRATARQSSLRAGCLRVVMVAARVPRWTATHETQRPGRSLPSGRPGRAPDLPASWTGFRRTSAGTWCIVKVSGHYLEVDDHARIRASSCSASWMRSANSAARGMQIHRSYWVAHRHIRYVVRRDRRTLLHLTGDYEVPVSRTFLPEVRRIASSRRRHGSAPTRPSQPGAEVPPVS